MSTIGSGTNPLLNLSGPAAGQAQSRYPQTQTLGQESFLQLMVTQLKNQDPVSPLDSSQFFSQLTQFSMVEGLQRVDQGLSQLQMLLQSTQALQASSLVGREVLVRSDLGYLGQDGALSGAIRLPAHASGLTVQILDMDGNVVHEMALGAQEAGLVEFAWDGLMANGQPAPSGSYRVRAESTIEGMTTPAETLVKGRVESVALGRGGAEMTLAVTGMNAVELSAVEEIL
jgi:flagellar basal-body rod modification protein FlgD